VVDFLEYIALATKGNSQHGKTSVLDILDDLLREGMGKCTLELG
jgi:hypothetical protein